MLYLYVYVDQDVVCSSTVLLRNHSCTCCIVGANKAVAGRQAAKSVKIARRDVWLNPAKLAVRGNYCCRPTIQNYLCQDEVHINECYSLDYRMSTHSPV